MGRFELGKGVGLLQKKEKVLRGVQNLLGHSKM